MFIHTQNYALKLVHNITHITCPPIVDLPASRRRGDRVNRLHNNLQSTISMTTNYTRISHPTLAGATQTNSFYAGSWTTCTGTAQKH